MNKSYRWVTLLLLCSSQFLVVLDGTLVNVALPAIQSALAFSAQNLQWVVNAYLLPFAGFLILGGRLADVLGRRRLFIGGLVLFALSSLLGGFAFADWALITSRVLQGIGAAIISPASLSLLTVSFKEGKARDQALGIYGAMGGSGAVAGLLLSGVLTQFFGWQWVFFAMFPIAGLVALLSLRFVEESKIESAEKGFDVAGALTITGGLVFLVYALVQTSETGWASLSTLSYFGLAIGLLSLFGFIELKSRLPMVDFKIFRYRSLTSANLISILFTACLGGTLFLLSLYLQQVLKYSALEAGLALLPFEISTIIAATGSARLVTKFGAAPIAGSGLTLLMSGLLVLTQITPTNNFWTTVLPGTILFGLGLTGTGIPLTIAAVSGLPAHYTGLASGLINTTQQVGFSLGLALLSTVASAYSLAQSGGANPSRQTLTESYQLAFLIAAGFAVTGLVLTVWLLRGEKPAIAETQPNQ